MPLDLVRLYRDHVDHLSRGAAAALGEEGLDALVVHSGALVKRSSFDDQYWPLRGVPAFEHWAHLGWPGSALLFVPGARPRLLALRDRSFWERAPEPDWALLSAALEVEEVEDPRAIRQRVGAAGRVAFIGDATQAATDWGVDADRVNPPGLIARLDELRVFKTPYEIACLAEANRVAARGHRAVREAFLAGERRELDLHLLYLATTRQDDAETPYKNIVAVGSAAAILHHVHYRRDASPARSLLLDAGATCRGYASDITRTHVALDGTEDAALFGALLEGMEALQRALVDGVRVGRPYESLHDEAHLRLGALLEATGVVRMSAEACVSTGVSRCFLPHGLGHSLGLQTHDVGCARIRPRPENAWLRNTRVIEAGQVFTIEPGVYFIDTFMEELRGGPHAGAIDWGRVEALAPFGGIRIEDDVVVLPDGAVTTSDNLTRAEL